MADALLDVAIYRGEVEAIVEREKEVHDEDIAQEIAENDLEIGHFGCSSHHAWYRDECDARECGANHTDCHYPPRRRVAATEEVGSGTFARTEIANGKDYSKIGYYDGDDDVWTHK